MRLEAQAIGAMVTIAIEIEAGRPFDILLETGDSKTSSDSIKTIVTSGFSGKKCRE